MPLPESVNAAPARNPMADPSTGDNLLAHFAQVMGTFTPFEKNPQIAIALSGGGDSMALLHLACQWAASCGAQISALTVDHGLRKDSRVEAKRVGRWAARLGVPHHVLEWHGEKPATAVQSTARDARYRLMSRWCAQQNILHLLTAHTRDDQIETHLMRKDHGSGPVGLAAMSQVHELADCRLLRPLLGTRRQDLRSYLNRFSISWAEDPSNRDEKFERVRWRNYIAAHKLPVDDLATTISHYGRLRRDESLILAKLAAATVTLHPLGWAIINLEALDRAADVHQRRLLARIAMVIGGRSYEPHGGQILALLKDLKGDQASGPAASTLGGCRFIGQNRQLRVLREYRNLPFPRPIVAGDTVHWDRRFKITFGTGLDLATGAATLRAFQKADWLIIKSQLDLSWVGGRAFDVCQTVPVIVDEEGVFAVPHLNYRRTENTGEQKNASEIVSYLSFCPPNSLSGNGFSVA